MTDGSETRPGIVWIGDNEISSEVDVFNATYNFQWEDADVDGDSLLLYDVQTALIVEWY